MRRSLIRFALALPLTLGPTACTQSAFWDTPASQAAGCHLDKRAEVAMADMRNFMLVTASLDGHPATLVVDTGAEATTLTPEAAQSFALPPDSARGSVLRGVSGAVRSRNVKLRRLELGGLVMQTGQSVGVSELPSFDGVDPPVAGLLGADVLAGYDVQLDLPGRRMTLYSAVGCGAFLPWAGARALPMQRTSTGLAFVNAVVDGRQVRALLDTGARTTLLTRQTAATLGVSEATLAQSAARSGVGIGMGSIAFRQHRFGTLGLPGAMARDLPVNIADLHLPGVEMLLGADYLGPRRPWISYSTGRLFLR